MGKDTTALDRLRAVVRARNEFRRSIDRVPVQVLSVALGYLSPFDLATASCCSPSFKESAEVPDIWGSFLLAMAQPVASPKTTFRNDPTSRRSEWLHVDIIGREHASFKLRQLVKEQTRFQTLALFIEKRPGHWLVSFVCWGIISPEAAQMLLNADDDGLTCSHSLYTAWRLHYTPPGCFIFPIERELQRISRHVSASSLLDLPSNHNSTLRSILSRGLSDVNLDSCAALHSCTRIFRSTTTAANHRPFEPERTYAPSILTAILSTPISFRSAHALAADTARAGLLENYSIICSSPEFVARILRASPTEVAMLTAALNDHLSPVQVALNSSQRLHQAPLTVQGLYRLLRLPVALQRGVARGEFTARSLAKVSATGAQELLKIHNLQGFSNGRGGALASGSSSWRSFSVSRTAALPRAHVSALTQARSASAHESSSVHRILTQARLASAHESSSVPRKSTQARSGLDRSASDAVRLRPESTSSSASASGRLA